MIPPWHMWGGSQNITLNPGLDFAKAAQLARVEFKRPDSWRFLLYAKVLRTNVTIVPSNVVVAFNVFQGVGRANVQIQHNPFETYLFQIALAGEQGDQPIKFSTQVVGPRRIDTAADSTSICDVIVAQDISVGFSAFLSNPPGFLPTDEVQLEVGCSLAPWHHVRPDWFDHGPMKFLGEETGGR